MTVFSQKFPLSLVLRIFDVFLAEGLRMIYRISVPLTFRWPSTAFHWHFHCLSLAFHCLSLALPLAFH